MAPTVQPTSSVAVPSTASTTAIDSTATSSFGGDDFANNLVSDLAPLLTLFGEQVTKQFMSMSVGWADHILLGVGPLGILTVVVSAIRVGGVRRLKALVGRARESRATAEQEMLSSTSDDVCELWNGREIVRVIGKPKTKEFILHTDTDGIAQVEGIERALKRGWLVNQSHRKRFMSTRDYRSLAMRAPNISLNVHKTMSSRKEIRICAVIGSIFQLAAWIIPGLSTYHWAWPKNALENTSNYAYPCFLIGALAITFGVVLCSHVIDATTYEATYIPNPSFNSHATEIFRVQLSCTAGDQNFPACIISNAPGVNSIRMSSLKDPGSGTNILGFKTTIATLVTITGFVCQFIGLRGLHWSATLVQLSVTLIVTALRSWTRRDLGNEPDFVPVSDDDLNDLALRIVLFCYAPLAFPREPGQFQTPRREVYWELFTGIMDNSRNIQVEPTLGPASLVAEKATTEASRVRKNVTEACTQQALALRAAHDPGLTVRAMLQSLTKQQDGLVALSGRLGRAITKTMDRLVLTVGFCSPVDSRAQLFREGITWTHWVKKGLVEVSEVIGQETHALTLQCKQQGSWFAPPELYALLALWTHHLKGCYFGEPHSHRAWNAQYQTDTRKRKAYIRILGRCDEFDYGFSEHLPKWIGRKLTLYPLLYSEGSGDPFHSQPIFGTSTLSSSLNSDSRIASGTNLDLAGYCKGGYQLCIEDPKIMEAGGVCVTDTLEADMEIHCALELYSGFLHGIAENIEVLPGRTFIEPEGEGPNTQIGERITCRNTVLSAIAQILVDESLVNNLPEANTIVIPPFARRGFLTNLRDGSYNIGVKRRAASMERV